jgi:hypothetical protein
MLRYLRNNGYPVDLEFKTEPYEDKEENFHGFKSEVFVDGVHFTDIIHSKFRSRVQYANGFLGAYEWEATGKYKWRGKKDPYNEQGELEVEVGDWIIDKEGYVRKVKMDSDLDMPYEDIKRHATKEEVENKKEINDLLDELSDLRESNKFSWDTYGSELCAGDMIGQEKSIENKIEKLRINVSKTKV